MGTLHVNKLQAFKLPKPTMVMATMVWVIPNYDEIAKVRHASQKKSWKFHWLAMYHHPKFKQKIWGPKQGNLQ